MDLINFIIDFVWCNEFDGAEFIFCRYTGAPIQKNSIILRRAKNASSLMIKKMYTKLKLLLKTTIND